MRHPSPYRPARTLLAVAVLPLALAACSSGTSDHPSAAPTKAAKDPDAGLLTGARLKKALAPASFFASGFAVDPDGARDSGATYTAPSASAAAKPDCSLLGGTSWIAVTGVSGVSSRRTTTSARTRPRTSPRRSTPSAARPRPRC
ncbi:hypothetical protein ACIA7S_30620 [Streptomyces sp. NPDC051643]|uniref:hypothetical protein n=1 Tax=Streptomyces sp. NPDC051643 TaxID=3365665 RepID=UPI003789BF78